MLQVLQLCKHVDLNRSQLPQQPRTLTCGTDWAQAELQETTETFTGDTWHVLCWRESSLMLQKQPTGSRDPPDGLSWLCWSSWRLCCGAGDPQPSLHSSSPREIPWLCSSWHFKVAVNWHEFPWERNHPWASLALTPQPSVQDLVKLTAAAHRLARVGGLAVASPGLSRREEGSHSSSCWQLLIECSQGYHFPPLPQGHIWSSRAPRPFAAKLLPASHPQNILMIVLCLPWCKTSAKLVIPDSLWSYRR